MNKNSYSFLEDALVFMEPRQARSQRTLEKILDACDELMAEGSFEEMSMQAIAQRAGVAVGSLYNRFSGKDALVQHLIERLQGRQLGFVERRLAAFSKRGLRYRLEFLAATIEQAVERDAGLLRAVAIRSLQRRSPVSSANEVNTGRFVAQLGGWLHGDGSEVRRSDGKAACRFVAASLAFSLQYAVILDTPVQLFGSRQYRQRLIDSAWAYLTRAEEG